MQLKALFCDSCGPENLHQAVDHIVIRSQQAGSIQVDVCAEHRGAFFAKLNGFAPNGAAEKAVKARTAGTPTQAARSAVRERILKAVKASSGMSLRAIQGALSDVDGEYVKLQATQLRRTGVIKATGRARGSLLTYPVKRSIVKRKT